MQKILELKPFHLTPNMDGPLKDKCFSLWTSVWENTFQELNVRKRISADDFLDRHIYGLQTANSDVCGFMLIRSFCSNRYTLEHSYFDNYPDSLKAQLLASNEPIQVISYMTIDPNWRKQNTDLPLSEILMGLCVLHFMNSSDKKLWGYFRNNRKTQDIFYRHGGQSVVSDHMAYNVLVDISCMDQKSAQLSSNTPCKVATLNFWNQLKQGEKYDSGDQKQHFVQTSDGTIQGDAMA